MRGSGRVFHASVTESEVIGLDFGVQYHLIVILGNLIVVITSRLAFILLVGYIWSRQPGLGFSFIWMPKGTATHIAYAT